jgi:nucleotide-binding universal stress UspA family protein
MLLHVLPEAAATKPHPGLVKMEAEQAMQKLIPIEADPWCDSEALFGTPAETILRAAKEDKVDLIVIGVRQADALVSHMNENTAYRMVTEADCPVLTVWEAA